MRSVYLEGSHGSAIEQGEAPEKVFHAMVEVLCLCAEERRSPADPRTASPDRDI